MQKLAGQAYHYDVHKHTTVIHFLAYSYGHDNKLAKYLYKDEHKIQCLS